MNNIISTNELDKLASYVILKSEAFRNNVMRQNFLRSHCNHEITYSIEICMTGHTPVFIPIFQTIIPNEDRINY